MNSNGKSISFEENYWCTFHLNLAFLINYKKIRKIEFELDNKTINNTFFIDISTIFNRFFWSGGIYLFDNFIFLINQNLFLECISWINKNLSPKTRIYSEGIIMFKSKKDAMAFKLQWL